VKPEADFPHSRFDFEYSEFDPGSYIVLCKKGKLGLVRHGKWAFTRFKLYEVRSMYKHTGAIVYAVKNNDGLIENIGRSEFNERFSKFIKKPI